MGKIIKVCPNCCQLYQLKALAQKGYGNIPLLLSCGHSMCENCVWNLVKFAEPIECKSCHQDMQIDVKDLALLLENKMSLHDLFPVNIYMLGELTRQYINPTNETNQVGDGKCYIDLEAVIKSTETTQGQCLECHAPTTKMCQQCATVLCLNCFNRSHKNFVIFKNHVLQNIEMKFKASTCTQHKDKPLDYYCKSCRKPICMDCFMVGGEKSCKSHDVVSVHEVNEGFISELTEMTPKIDELFRRLSKTAVDIGNNLLKIHNESGISEVTKMMNNIEQHYSKLTSQIQRQKEKITTSLLDMATSEKDSLERAKVDVENAIKKATKFTHAVKSLDHKQLKDVNISAILEDGKKLLDTPWYLNKGESNDSIKISVNEELSETLKDYVRVEGASDTSYRLCSTSELRCNNIEVPEAPHAPVFPPKLMTDVRQNVKPKDKEPMKTPTLYKNAPRYHSKSGSCSSLNSINSDSSQTTYNSYNQYNKANVQQVQPFTESQHARQLQEGSQELIYISHIVDPHNLFVQRACDQVRVDELLREFRNAVSLPKPSVNHVAEGKVYLVYNPTDNLWLRCRIISIDRRKENMPKYHVFCIDFGGTEIVEIDKLRLLPPARVHSPPPFAINCSLTNCEPKNGTWTSDDAFLIQSIIDNKQAVMHVRRVRSTGSDSAALECDVTTFEHGVSLSHALLFHGRALMPHRLPYPKSYKTTEKPKIYISHNDFKPNSVEQVLITHIVNPDHFYIRKRHLQDVYDKLCEDLEHEYNMNVQSGMIYLPEKDMVCVIRAEKSSSAWFRAVIRELPGRGRVRVTLLDTGASLLLHWTALRRIHSKFTTLRALATECHLAGVTPINKIWSPSAVTLLGKFMHKYLEIHVEDERNNTSLGVTLYDNSDPDNIMCINKVMVKHNFAVTFGVFVFNEENVDEQVITNKSPICDKMPQSIENKTEDTKKSHQKSKKSKQDLEAKDKGPLRLEVKVLNYQSPSLLYVCLVQQQKSYNEMYEKMQCYYTKKNDPCKTREVGARCACLCIQSKTWRRAAILEIIDDNVKVFYSDFASIETVPWNSLRELTKEFTAIGDGAIMCHLFGVTPAVGDEWPSLTKEYLKELLDAYQRLFITKTGNFKGKSMPVELWVYHTIQGGALEPNTSEWRCLNKKIIEQGLGIPDKNEEINLLESSDDKSADNTLAFLNMAGTVSDWLQLEPLPTKPRQLIQELDSNNSTTPDIDKTDEGPRSSNTVFISDWLPPEPLQSVELTAMPTYIDNDGVIFLHDICQQDTLDLIRKALDVRFKSPDPKAKYAKWTVGEPCIAHYFLDNKFYRGKVLEVHEDISSCLIHYIDYGNEEVCSFENLRKSIALYQIPIQAHKCILNRIKPIGKKWDRQTLDYIHKSTVEKHCFVKVVGEAEGLAVIELKFDKLWINDHLVDFEMAQYIDGTKAVVRMYAPSITSPKPVEDVESDSGPDDIIVKDDNLEKSIDTLKSGDVCTSPDLTSGSCGPEVTDWNKLMEEEEEEQKADYVSFSKHCETEFCCNVCIVTDVNTLELSVVVDEDKISIYETMYLGLQEDCGNMNALNGIFENKACVAIFPDDGLWYRAIILQYSQVKGLVKVKYVDYANTAVVSLADVREINNKYLELPPATLTAKLHNVIVNPDVDVMDVAQEYSKVFLDNGPFHCKVLQYDGDIPAVELKINNKLVYENLFDKNIFIKYDEN